MTNSKITIRKIKTERALSPTGIKIADYTLNPYRGCSFGCDYCYVRMNKFVRKATIPYGGFVDIKENLVPVLERQLKEYGPKKVLIGAVTDPYQPIEREYRVTREILLILKEHGVSPFILTKSHLILEDAELLSSMKKATVCFTLNHDFISQRFEYGTSSQIERERAIQELNASGVYTYVHIGPYFPFITDYKPFLEKTPRLSDRINFESLNFKMIFDEESFFYKLRLFDSKVPGLYRRMMKSKEFYNSYWDELKKDIERKANALGVKTTIMFRPFDEYYKNDTKK